MSEERSIAIEAKLDSLVAGQEAMTHDLRGEMREMGDGLARDLRSEMREIKDELSGQIAALDHQMRVLHEDTIANIKALAPDFEPIRREYRKADAKLKEEILEQLARARRRE